MAIYNVEYMDENAKNDDLLDGMLEACDDMMQMVESTAAQRRYGVTSKDIDEYYKDDSNVGVKASKYIDSKNPLGYMAVRNSAKNMRPDTLDKNMNRGINIGSKIAQRAGGSITDRQKEEIAVQQKAAIKGATGSLMGRAARAGYDVKGTFDKAREKDAKKKAIKETCLNILSIIDEL